MNTRLGATLLALCSILPPAVSWGQGSESNRDQAAWTRSLGDVTKALELAPHLGRGRELYRVCSECHRANGAGYADGTMPQLAGQHRSVLIKQMMDIRSGLRRNPQMYPYVARLDGPQDLVDLAGFLETLPFPKGNGQGPGTDLERGEQLYTEQCARCHGAGGEGSAESFYPKLASQHYRYLVRQLIDTASGRRGNAHPAMAAAVAEFSARDVALVADYVSRLNAEAH
jgi:cytochrome c553